MPDNMNRVHVASPRLEDDDLADLIRAAKSGQYVLGEENRLFESEFSEYCGSKFAIAVSSGTAALHLSLLSLGIKTGDEVITSSYSFAATANTILYTGATPVFADIDPQTMTLDPSEVRRRITRRTKAIMPVHIFGHPAQMDELLELARENDLAVIEDACQAHGARFKNHIVGAIGDIGCFSFYPTKNMTVCGDGGMVVTNNSEIAEQIRILRNQGQSSKYLHSTLGYNYRLNEMNAAIGRKQLRKLENWNNRRRTIAKTYTGSFAFLTTLRLPQEMDWAHHVYHQYVVRCPNRNALREWLTKRGIDCLVHYEPPIHLQPYLAEAFRVKLPVTERCSSEALSIPCHQYLTEPDLERICDEVRSFFKSLQ